MMQVIISGKTSMRKVGLSHILIFGVIHYTETSQQKQNPHNALLDVNSIILLPFF